MLPTIDVQYSCVKCSLKNTIVTMYARQKDEPVAAWMREVVVKKIVGDHLQKSPDCKAIGIENLKIPTGAKQ